jgi:hypothetical protein
MEAFVKWLWRIENLLRQIRNVTQMLMLTTDEIFRVGVGLIHESADRG